MSYTAGDAVREMAEGWLERHGIPTDDGEGFMSHVWVLLDSHPAGDVLRDIDFSYYEGYCEDQRVEAEVERHAA